MIENGIHLKRRDYDEPIVKECVQKVLQLIGDNKAIFDAVIECLRSSTYWDVGNFTDKYNRWKSYTSEYKCLANKAVFDAIIEDCYRKTSNEGQWGKFRGTLAESIVNRAFKVYYDSLAHVMIQEYETGCAVFVDGTVQKYTCPEKSKQKMLCSKDGKACPPSGNCKGDKQTVDIGSLSITGGKVMCRADLVEVKLSPKGIQYLDGSYLKYVKQSIESYPANCEIYVATLEDFSITQIQVKHCMDNYQSVKVWGIEEVKKWYFA